MGDLLCLPPRLSVGGGGIIMHAATRDVVVSAHLRYLGLRGLAPGSVYGRACALARMQAAIGVPLIEASAEDLASWREGLSVSPGTVVGYVSHARGFYAWLVATGLREDNPATALPMPRLGRRLPRPIGEDHLFAAIAGAPDRIRPWLVLAGWEGLRAQEIAYLRREHVLDTARPDPLLFIASSMAKGGHERVVPLCDFALAELQAVGLPARGWVFGRADGKPGSNRPSRISHLCNDYLHQAGITESLHQLRHRFGTQTYAVEPDLRRVQEWLGHSNPATTAGYTAFNQRRGAGVINQLPVPGRLRVVSE